MIGIVAAICGLFGLLAGSFLNVVIWRVPRNESIVRPSSHCPACDSPIAPYDNVPVVSWLGLRGRCRKCGVRISLRYPFVELLTGVLFAAVGARFFDSWSLPAFLWLTAGLIALSAIDLETYLLPNRIVYPLGIGGAVLLASAALLDNDWSDLGRAGAGALIAFVFFYVVYVVAPRGGFGFGYVRLSAVLGLYLGWLGWAYIPAGLFAGFLYGAVAGLAVIAVVGMRGRKYHVPFGPFLAAGTMTFVLFGEPILDWYRGLGR